MRIFHWKLTQAVQWWFEHNYLMAKKKKYVKKCETCDLPRILSEVFQFYPRVKCPEKVMDHFKQSLLYYRFSLFHYLKLSA